MGLAHHLSCALLVLAGCSFEPGLLPRVDGDVVAEADASDAARPSPTLFVAAYISGTVSRFRLAPGVDPALDLTFGFPGALSPVIAPGSGELLVSELSIARLDRFATPLAMPSFNGAITGPGLAASIAKMVQVETELWAVNSVASYVVRLAIDGNGGASMLGTFSVTNGRGMVFDPGRRQVWVSQCCNSNTIEQFDVDANRTATFRASLVTGGINNPHGLIVTPWSELLVANAGTSSILRYSLDPSGTATLIGAITGNDLSVPIDMVLTSWGELFVTNGVNNTISRFGFDASHGPIARGSFVIPGAQSLGYAALAE